MAYSSHRAHAGAGGKLCGLAPLSPRHARAGARSCARACARPDTQARAGAEPMPMSIAEFDAFLRADIIRQAEYIRLARITPS